MPGSDDNKREHSIGEIENWNLDRSTDAPTKVVGMMGKDSSGNWLYLSASTAARLMVSGTFTSSPLSADSSSVSAFQGDASKLRISGVAGDAGQFLVSAKQGDAGLLLVSSKQGDAALFRTSAIVDSGSISAKSSDAGIMLVSAKQGDAGLLRMSAIGGTTGDNVIVDGTDQSISAKLVQVSASISSNANAIIFYAQNRSDAAQFRASAFSDDGAKARVSAVQDGAGNLNVSAKSDDGAKLRTSAVQDGAGNLNVSAKSLDAGTLRVSGIQGDAANLRVSAIIDSGSISAKSLDAGTMRVSAIVDSGSISAKSGDANQLHVSAVQGDAGLLRVSAQDIVYATFFTSAFDIASTGGVAVVNGASSKKIYIYAVNLTLNASNGIKWQSGSTDLQGITRLSASAGYTMAVPPPAYVIATTSAGQDLNLGLSATGTSASGWVAGWSQ